MAAVATATDEAAKTRAWQVWRLVDLGCSLAEAEAIAAVARSWHDAERMILAGASPDLVRKILE